MVADDPAGMALEYLDRSDASVHTISLSASAGTVRLLNVVNSLDTRSATSRHAVGSNQGITCCSRVSCHTPIYNHTCEKAAKRKYRCLLWKYTQNYADAKTAVVEEILTRAQEAAREEVREDN